MTQLVSQIPGGKYFLTGGLCEEGYIVERLSLALKKPVISMPMARFAGAVGAAVLAQE